MNRTTLTALPGGKTQVDVTIAVEPRGAIGWLAARLYIGRKLLGDLMRTYRSFGELALAAEQVAPPPRAQAGGESLRAWPMAPIG